MTVKTVAPRRTRKPHAGNFRCGPVWNRKVIEAAALKKQVKDT